ncbi:MAG: hypothetical protein WCW93_01190 [Candidatus Paceibacterota bacterium]
MKEGKRSTYELKEHEYSFEEFNKQFNNFHLIFAVDNKEYMSSVKGVLLSGEYSKKFEEIKEKFNKRIKDEKKRKTPSDIKQEHISDLYEIYKDLRKKGFSNKQLGLKYW